MKVNADIIVLPEYRKKDIGNEFLKKLCEEADSLEFKELLKEKTK